MNKNIKLAVAGAILASASIANAGIVIPAGDWTLDVSGNVNSFMSNVKTDGTAAITGGLVDSSNALNNKSVNSIGTGLLPNFLSIGGSTRQNDVDVAFAISIQPGGDVGSAGAYGTQNNRQAYLTFGDKSWGSVKLGKDLGIFASDAILNDMTLLGMGAGAGLGNASYGRIGSGFQYADWKSQVAYTTPNMGGFQATVGATQNWDVGASTSTGTASSASSGAAGRPASPAFEGKASYSFANDQVTGKVWVSGISQKVSLAGVRALDTTAYMGDIGVNLNVAGVGLTAYGYSGSGLGTTFQFLNGYTATGLARDSSGGYVQATYVLPTKTKVGVSWGESTLDTNGAADASANTGLVKSNEMTTVGAYHPLTKHLNLVAEYSHIKSEAQSGVSNKADSISLGGILFY
jgi:predicted porin